MKTDASLNESPADICLLGAGKLAHQLGKALFRTGHRIPMVWARRPDAAADLADELGAESCSDLNELPLNCDFYVLAVPDSAIPVISEQLGKVEGMVIHCSGTAGIDAIQQVHRAVAWPVQSLRKTDETDFSEVPFLLEASNAEGMQRLKDLLMSISGELHQLDGDKREILHLGAVMVNNFSYHLLSETRRRMASEGLEFSLLKPLLEQTIRDVFSEDYRGKQTGPAARRDRSTLERHLALLEQYPGLQGVYRALSKSIADRQNNSD